MISVFPGQTFYAEVSDFPPGLPAGTVGARILDGAGNEIIARTTAGITESPTIPGTYGGLFVGPAVPADNDEMFWDWDPTLTYSSRTAREQLVVQAPPTAAATVPALVAAGAAGKAVIPHLAMPFRFHSDGAAVTEQDSLDEVRDCVANIAAYRQGDRPEKPGFGIPDQTFALNGPDPQLLVSTIAVQEPRASLAAVVDPSQLEALIASVDLTAAINVNVDLKGGS